jgi:hypothetical protein
MPSLAQWDAYAGVLRNEVNQLDNQVRASASDSGGGGGGFDQALEESAGWEREKLSAQLKDAEAGRANAYKIASLQAKTQRYGIDQSTMVELKKLTETQRQFDANHDLDMKKFGLSYAQTATDYLSSPDRFAQGMDFRQMADRARNGQGPTPYGTDNTFQPKTEADFGVLASYGQPGASGASSAWSPARTGVAAPFAPLVTTPAGGTATATAPGVAAGGGVADTESAQVAGATGNEGTTPDPRIKALKGIIDAVPPSSGPGHDDNDIAVMQAAQALYSTNLKPGTYQSMRPDQQAILGSFIKRSGRSLNDWKSDYDSYQPYQRSVRAA